MGSITSAIADDEKEFHSLARHYKYQGHFTYSALTMLQERRDAPKRLDEYEALCVKYNEQPKLVRFPDTSEVGPDKTHFSELRSRQTRDQMEQREREWEAIKPITKWTEINDRAKNGKYWLVRFYIGRSADGNGLDFDFNGETKYGRFTVLAARYDAAQEAWIDSRGDTLYCDPDQFVQIPE